MEMGGRVLNRESLMMDLAMESALDKFVLDRQTDILTA